MRVGNLTLENYFPSRQARVVVIRQRRQEPVPQHRHEFCELALVSGGSGVHVTGSFRQELVAGDVLVITGKRAHGYEKTQGLNLINVLMRHEIFPRIARELRMLPGYEALFGDAARRKSYVSHMRLSPDEYKQVEEWVDRLEAETHQSGQAGNFLAEAYLTLILGVLCRYYGRNSEARLRRPGPRLGPVLTAMEKQIRKPMKVADLARQAGMSERSFYRDFQKTLGVSPAQHLIKTRVQQASDRLLYGDPNRRIGEIAEECGFEDSNYFSRVFRKAYGLSPREYRQRHNPPRTV